MSLKNRLFSQHMTVLVCTVLVTACLSLLFFQFYTRLNHIPMEGAAVSSHIVVAKEMEVIYSSGNFDEYQLKNILMDAKMKNKNYTYKNTQYKLTAEPFNEAQGSVIIRLTPILDLDAYYRTGILIIIAVFFITFLIANWIAEKKNREHIIHPIVELKTASGKLADGELDTPVVTQGYGEIAELCDAVEHLRLKLKDSVYYQEKYDENRKFLISSISHDLKTPVTAVRGYVEGILDGVANTPEKRELYLKKALDKTNLISVMIEDLLLYSKLDLNQVPFELEPVDITSYLENAVEDNEFVFQREQKCIGFENTLERPWQVTLDRKKFQRVVQNVTDNARKHMDAEGTLLVRLREANSSVIIEFKDNGHGISQADLPHIFDRFYRADSARRVEGSSGLGLAIAKQIVEGLGGRIWAVSKENQGTSIMISLKKQVV